MEFLVRITIGLPDVMPADRQVELRTLEMARAAELRASGCLVRIWRDPGRTANWSLYEVDDATALDKTLASLPLFPWMKIQVHPLAVHPAESDHT